jgi:hypothetical protein
LSSRLKSSQVTLLLCAACRDTPGVGTDDFGSADDVVAAECGSAGAGVATGLDVGGGGADDGAAEGSGAADCAGEAVGVIGISLADAPGVGDRSEAGVRAAAAEIAAGSGWRTPPGIAKATNKTPTSARSALLRVRPTSRSSTSADACVDLWTHARTGRIGRKDDLWMGRDAMVPNLWITRAHRQGTSGPSPIPYANRRD